MNALLRIVLAIACPAASAVAAPQTFNFDTAHSTVVFRVSHNGLAHVFGRFRTVSGSVNLDPANLSSGLVKATIDANSVDTNNERRDKHLRSPDFFNAGEFDSIEFNSTSLEVSDDNSGTLKGDLTLLGVTKPVTLDVTVNHSGPHPDPRQGGAATVGVSASGKITRSDFGMTGFLPGVGDEIDLWIEVEAVAK